MEVWLYNGNLESVEQMRLVHWIFYPKLYLLLGDNSLIWKYTGQTLEPDDLKMETPSVLNFKDMFSGWESGPLFSNSFL